MQKIFLRVLIYCMNVRNIQGICFKENANKTQLKKREFIDVFSDSVKNPRDVNDMVAVPRGIFKAYLLIMTGSALLALSNLVPNKKPAGKFAKTSMIVLGWVLNTLSAIYFAKPFAFKGNSPTINREELKQQYQ